VVIAWRGANLLGFAAVAGVIASILYGIGDWTMTRFLLVYAVVPGTLPPFLMRSRRLGFLVMSVVCGLWLLVLSTFGLLFLFVPSALLVLSAAATGTQQPLAS
jgi:hypothetical protein